LAAAHADIGLLLREVQLSVPDVSGVATVTPEPDCVHTRSKH
jgi:hypothetical protein